MKPVILEINNVKKYYPEVRAVDGISFSIKQGTCFGLLGPNGAGKTTLIEAIEGLLTITSGEILYKNKTRDHKFKEEVGIQFQNTELPQFLTVKETLETFRNLYNKKKDLDELISMCQLQDILKRDNRKISGGQKQRLLLAIALANDPELVFLDEPTTGLDPQARRHLWNIVKQIKKQNKTIILTTHYMEEAQILCDTLAIIDSGKVIVSGSPVVLLQKHSDGDIIQIPRPVETSILDKTGGHWHQHSNTVEIHTADINKCMQILIQNKIDLTGTTVRSQNLEDIFLKLTGKQLRS